MRSHHASAALRLRCTLGCAVCCCGFGLRQVHRIRRAHQKVGRVERGQAVFLHVPQPGKVWRLSCIRANTAITVLLGHKQIGKL